MRNSTVFDCRTVAIVKDLTVEKRKGANGEFESKEILFRIAVDRSYKVTRTENGKTISETPTDFWLAKATGNVAQIFADNCTAKKEDGKLVSRHILVSGNFETYSKPRIVKASLQANINGQLYNVEGDVSVPDVNTIFVIDEIKFLDPKPNTQPANTVPTVTVASVTPATTSAATSAATTPVAPAQPVTPVAPAQPVTPVAPAQPVTPVAPVAPAQPVAVQAAPAMNPPVVSAGFDGQTAPF